MLLCLNQHSFIQKVLKNYIVLMRIDRHAKSRLTADAVQGQCVLVSGRYYRIFTWDTGSYYLSVLYIPRAVERDIENRQRMRTLIPCEVRIIIIFYWGVPIKLALEKPLTNCDAYKKWPSMSAMLRISSTKCDANRSAIFAYWQTTTFDYLLFSNRKLMMGNKLFLTFSLL